MSELTTLDKLFKDKIFRIPDYQRGYAWQKSQLKDFWEDLVNLPSSRSHYTGLLTLKEMKSEQVKENQNEYWLIDDYSYKMYEVIDGQQRLTTTIILIQSFIDFMREKYPEKEDKDIFVSDTLNLSTIVERFLYRTKPTKNEYRTYKFGYAIDNPSEEFLRYRIFKEPNAGTITETFYTLNLRNANLYFKKQLEELAANEGMDGLLKLFRKLTKNFLFNEFIIKDEFDVFVAFETMNNRGKKLSDLELLKNRLIYLTTLYSSKELDEADRTSMRNDINLAWKEAYHQLGRNEKRPLNDDDFLKAHWIMYFKYSRKRGNDYIKFLLDEQFSPQRIYENTERAVELEDPEEQREDEINEAEDIQESADETALINGSNNERLSSSAIKDYVHSLKASSVHWFNSHYPEFATGMDPKEVKMLDRLNRIGMGYFRPLVMSILKNEAVLEKRLEAFKSIERFIFLVFRLDQVRRTYRDSEFYNAARELDQKKLTIDEIKEKLEYNASYFFNEDGSIDESYFYELLKKKFSKNNQSGYYGWNGLRYFLYEYESSLQDSSRQKKVDWNDLLKTLKDRITIEHIFPQTPDNNYWQQNFRDIDSKDLYYYQGSLGNLLLLSGSINSSLQNDSFQDKKKPKYDLDNNKIRNGYSDGSHSEIEVSAYQDWTPDAIRERGMKLLNFMEKRWNIKFKDEEAKERLLFLDI
ncbi:GmrSD restriction endonuclease domain-containing protein [Planococcus lenghuensis]|uniref:DUF262 domain-containing protein n=1 Tax=Planococcus lenghuensis TaxID=2213202 RepID=A0A1Q2KVL4_9BACL|nr:DUF262 domain-containing protein [Planococcus lenghuensis]AQQ52258.1 hypothetical protein B0X71_03445 [Planococcus lenghuensis]